MRRSAPRCRPICAAAAPICAFCARDRKSTRLNSSHSQISYAVFCLKKKTINKESRHVSTPHPDTLHLRPNPHGSLEPFPVSDTYAVVNRPPVIHETRTAVINHQVFV